MSTNRFVRDWYLSLFLTLGMSIVPTDVISKTDELYVYYPQEYFLTAINSEQEESFPAGPLISAYRHIFNDIGLPKNIEYLPKGRLLGSMDEDRPICALYMRKTEQRESKFSFSFPVAFSQNFSLYSLKDLAESEPQLFDNNGQLKSISELMSRRNKETILQVADYSYGTRLDSDFARIDSQRKFLRRATHVASSQAEMFFKKRVDFAVMMPLEIVAYQRSNKVEKHFRYPIQDVSVVTGHTMCNRHPVAKRWLTVFNQALLSLYKTDEFIEYHRTIVDENDWAWFEKSVGAQIENYLVK